MQENSNGKLIKIFMKFSGIPFDHLTSQDFKHFLTLSPHNIENKS